MLEHRPAPWRITFDTNPDDCNLSCIMCEEHSDLSEKKRLRITQHLRHRRMDAGTIRQIVAEMAPRGLREIIPSTMGEPLLYREFDEILDLCRQFGIKLNLTTNGTWPHRGSEGWAAVLCPVTSDVKVSWNGTRTHTQEAIMVGSSLKERTRNLRSFLSVRDRVAANGGNRCRVTLQSTFMERNLEELPELVEFAASLGVDRVKGHHLWVHFGELSEDDLRRSPESRARWNATVRRCHEVAQHHRKEDGTTLELDNFLPLPEEGRSIVPADWDCPFLGQEAWVNHAGRFDPCCAPDLERASLGYFGSALAEGGLTAIWLGAPYRSLVSEYLGRAVCQTCTLRRPRLQPQRDVGTLQSLT